ncbi:MAG TPA: hypothetical protein VFW12_03440, partial [Candidatus Limnocylindria bacterium]|nr:hypothetical protein [Candidatus Limnocylindria bacterium]
LITEAGSYRLYEAPTTGYTGLVGIAERRSAATQGSLFQQNRAWARTTGPADAAYIRWDYPAERDGPSPVAPRRPCPDGRRAAEEQFAPGRIRAVVRCSEAATLLFKTSYHPNWVVTVDGTAAEPYMASPSYLAVDLPAGEHVVVAEYRSHPLKVPLLLVGAIAALGIAGGPAIWRRARKRS